MLTEKEKGILDKTEDAIARKLDEVLESKEPIQDTTLSVVMDGVRILDRIRLMRGKIRPFRKICRAKLFA